MRLKDTKSEVDRYRRTGGDRSEKLEENTRAIVGRAAATQRRDVEKILAAYGRRAGGAPPYEKRINGTELWGAVIKTYYRANRPSDRLAHGAAGLVRKRIDQAGEREDA